MPTETRRRGAAHASALPRLDRLVVVAVLALCAAALAGYAWTRPMTTTVPNTYEQSGSLSYSAPAAATSVYGSSGVRTGNPVYLSTVHALTFRYAYRFEAPTQTALRGTERLVVTVTDGAGLARTIPLQPVQHFSGGRFSTTATLPVASLDAVLTAFAKASGYNEVTYDASVHPNVTVTGTVGGASLHGSFNKGFAFTVSPTTLSLASKAGTGSAAAARPIVQTGSGALPAATTAVATLGPGIPVNDVRIGALVALAILLGLVLLFGLPLLGDARSDDERVRIATWHHASLVDVAELPPSAHLTVVELRSFDGLAQVSRQLECPLLHHRSAACDVYAVVDTGTLYRYTVRTARPVVPGDALDEAPMHPEGPTEAPADRAGDREPCGAPERPALTVLEIAPRHPGAHANGSRDKVGT